MNKDEHRIDICKSRNHVLIVTLQKLQTPPFNLIFIYQLTCRDTPAEPRLYVWVFREICFDRGPVSWE